MTSLLYDVFMQKASMGGHPASTCRLVVSLLFPGSLEGKDWLLLARHMSLMQLTSNTVASNLPTEQFVRRERRLQAAILSSTLPVFFCSVTLKKVISEQDACEQVRFLHTTLLEHSFSQNRC